MVRSSAMDDGRRAVSRFADEIPRLEFNRRRVFLEGDADRIAARGYSFELI